MRGRADNVNINCCTLIFIFTIALSHNVHHQSLAGPPDGGILSQLWVILIHLLSAGQWQYVDVRGQMTLNVSHIIIMSSSD